MYLGKAKRDQLENQITIKADHEKDDKDKRPQIRSVNIRHDSIFARSGYLTYDQYATPARLHEYEAMPNIYDFSGFCYF